MADDEKETVEAAESSSAESPKEDPPAAEAQATANSDSESTEPEAQSIDDDLSGVLDEEAQDNSKEEEINIDEVIAEADPSFAKEMGDLSATDFSSTEIKEDKEVAKALEQEKVPSAFRSFITNLPKEVKTRYGVAFSLIALAIIVVALILSGKLLPTFELPYHVSMEEFTQKVTTYPTDGLEVPLFDDFRSKSFTFSLPKITITLKKTEEGAAYGDFEFFLNLRDKDLAPQIKLRQTQIIDLVQRTLEEVSWRELQSPIGKERVKKVLRHRINEHLQGNHVLGVYYRSVILQK